MSDFRSFTTNTTSPALDAFEITPSATALAVIPRAIVADVGGTVTVRTFHTPPSPSTATFRLAT